MTPNERLTLEARWCLLGEILPLLPAGLAYAYCVCGVRTGALYDWCAAYWWVLLLGGSVVYIFVRVLTSFLALRCPLCRVRLTRFVQTKALFATGKSGMHYCPACGKPLDDKI